MDAIIPTVEPIEEVIGALEFYLCKVEPCGSRVTCDPAPTDTDQDYLVEVKDDEKTIAQVVNRLDSFLFHWEGGEHYQQAMTGDFMSWRRGDVNLIVTANAAFAERHRTATALCKRLNLLNKDDRVALFQAVLYGKRWDGGGWKPEMPEIKEAEIAF